MTDDADAPSAAETVAGEWRFLLDGAESPEEAFALVVANLPEDSGPAVLGGAGRV
ncbi:DUF6193 family natural product biosynthesis protein [Streptomyces sp. SR27]|uniref:DUF6193 family natural product biosynthesis protein n=1 Tax=Streptomyces sp. SR27 TaxID=3076630 RepID=UPI00295C33E1|nr:DUF6193 family natural product biosynthesis protein [Streptomyces sp. SR27]MDV9187433.1 DUF6193 family natural product biosynthesis protein [Streptomyces sp. SR27]